MTILFDLSDAASYEAYFLAIANKRVGENQYLYGDIEIGIEDSADWKGKKLWAWPTVRARGAGENDNYYLTREGTIWLGGPCTSEKHADEHTWYFDCEAEMKKILSKLIFDFTESKLSTRVSGYTLQRSDMTIGSTKFIGCELIFTFDDPDNLEYDETDWED